MKLNRILNFDSNFNYNILQGIENLKKKSGPPYRKMSHVRTPNVPKHQNKNQNLHLKLLQLTKEQLRVWTRKKLHN